MSKSTKLDNGHRNYGAKDMQAAVEHLQKYPAQVLMSSGDGVSFSH